MGVAAHAVRSAAFSFAGGLISHATSFAAHCVRGKGPKNRMLQGGMNVTALSDGELHASLKHLGLRDCETTADIIAHLAEVDKRKLYLTHGFPTLTRYCHRPLRHDGRRCTLRT